MRVAPDRIVVGDLVRIDAGDQVVPEGRIEPTDGLRLDEAILTGESERVERGGGSPAGKRRIVEVLRDAGRSVAMVGDGVKDVRRP